MDTPLYWWSNGNPAYSLAELVKAVYKLKAKGITSIPKGVIIDSTYFISKRPLGFQNYRGSNSYLTRPSAVAVEGNIISVEAIPKGNKVEVKCTPASPFINCTSIAKVGTKTKGLFAYAKTIKGGTLEVILKGTLSAKAKKEVRRVRSFDPTKFTAGVLIQVLRAAGIKVPDKYKRGKSPAGLTTYYKTYSEPLHILIRNTNQHSNNFWAENITRALGAHKHGAPGSTSKGLREINALLVRSGVRHNWFNLSNGSGLFGRSKIASKHLVKFMERLYTIPWLHRIMFKSLARPGQSGTLYKRFRGHAGASAYLYAKTGTLSTASCLAGYLVKGRKTILFAVMNDRIKGNIRAARLYQDEVVRTLIKRLRGRRIKTRPKRLF